MNVKLIQAEVKYTSVTANDIVAMIPVMTELFLAVRSGSEFRLCTEQDGKIDNCVTVNVEQAKTILRTLLECGFSTGNDSVAKNMLKEE